MKRQNLFNTAIARTLAASGVLLSLTAGCGSGNGNAPPPITTSALTGQVCTTGINGQQVCTQLSGGCVPLSSPIAFTGTNVALGSNGASYSTLYAGTIPLGGGTYGQTAVGTSTTLQNYQYSGLGDQSGTQISMSVSGSTLGYSAQTTGSIVGSLQLSYLMQSAATTAFSAYSGNGLYGQNCVSNIALVGQFYAPPIYGFTGTVYLYMNGTAHGYSFPVY